MAHQETEHDPHGTSAMEVKRLTLEVVEGEDKGATFTTTDQSASIGAHPSNALVLNDPRVSRFHCELQVDEAGVRVVDTGSRNGTTLDGVRIEKAFVREGSLLRVGRSTLGCHFVDGAASVALSERARFGRLVGRSIPMRATFATMTRAAASEATVLLQGETGTGKEVAARSLHEASSRSGGPFVVVDCTALTLSESELFGHMRGAFTDAVSDRMGAFERANGGTVFLDEIGEVPIELQPKLLRVLEERTVQRVGGTERLQLDVRIIAATHRDLRLAVNEATFRSDLYYRLAVIIVRLPALRERPDDIPMIAQALIERLDIEDSRREELLDDEYMARLKRAAWPGNVRQLRNHLELAAILGTQASHLEAAPDEAVSPIDTNRPFFEARAEFERRYLAALLQEHKDSPTAVAAASGLSRTYLYELLQKYGLR